MGPFDRSINVAAYNVEPRIVRIIILYDDDTESGKTECDSEASNILCLALSLRRRIGLHYTQLKVPSAI